MIAAGRDASHDAAATVCAVISALFGTVEGVTYTAHLAEQIGEDKDRTRRVTQQLAAFGWTASRTLPSGTAWRLGRVLPVFSMANAALIGGRAAHLRSLRPLRDRPVDTSIHRGAANTARVVEVLLLAGAAVPTRQLAEQTGLDQRTCQRIGRELARAEWVELATPAGPESWRPSTRLLAIGPGWQLRVSRLQEELAEELALLAGTLVFRPPSLPSATSKE